MGGLISMRPRLILDGYNVIKALEELRIKEDISLEAGRQALINRMTAYKSSHPGVDVTVVFDAAGAPDSGWGTEQTKIRNLKIIFDRKCADSRIKKIVETSSNPRAITVVSGDKGITVYARGLGAKILSPAELFQRLKTSNRAGKEQAVKTDKPLPGTARAREIDQELKQMWGIN